MDIDRPVTDIIIAADHEVGVGPFQLVDVLAELIQKFVLKILPLIAAGAGRKIYTHHRHMLKINTDIAPFTVVMRDAAAVLHVLWRLFGEYSRTTVALLFSREPIMLVTQLLHQEQVGQNI